MISSKKFSKILLRLQKNMGVFLLCLLTLLLSVQVFSRYILNASIGWTEEVARFVFIWLIFMGAVIATKNRQHLRVETFHSYFSYSFNTLIEIFYNVLIVVFFIYIIPSAFRHALRAYPIRSTASGLSASFYYFSFPLCSLFMTIYFISQIIEDINKLIKYNKSKKNQRRRGN